VGGFDEQIHGLGDDREFGLRLWWYGYRVCLCSQAQAFHLREAEGGTREPKSRWQRWADPEPLCGWVYFYRKWFPGLPYRQMVFRFLFSALKHPWSFPGKLVRLRRAISLARVRLKEGPRYISPPTVRSELEALHLEAGREEPVCDLAV
jgi:GT2 family glycosyltransferase